MIKNKILNFVTDTLPSNCQECEAKAHKVCKLPFKPAPYNKETKGSCLYARHEKCPLVVSVDWQWCDRAGEILNSGDVIYQYTSAKTGEFNTVFEDKIHKSMYIKNNSRKTIFSAYDYAHISDTKNRKLLLRDFVKVEQNNTGGISNGN